MLLPIVPFLIWACKASVSQKYPHLGGTLPSHQRTLRDLRLTALPRKLGRAANRAGAIGCGSSHLRLKADSHSQLRLIGCLIVSAFADGPRRSQHDVLSPPAKSRTPPTRRTNSLRCAPAARKQHEVLAHHTVGSTRLIFVKPTRCDRAKRRVGRTK